MSSFDTCNVKRSGLHAWSAHACYLLMGLSFVRNFLPTHRYTISSVHTCCVFLPSLPSSHPDHIPAAVLCMSGLWRILSHHLGFNVRRCEPKTRQKCCVRDHIVGGPSTAITQTRGEWEDSDREITYSLITVPYMVSLASDLTVTKTSKMQSRGRLHRLSPPIDILQTHPRTRR